MSGKKESLRDQIGIVHGLAWTPVGGATLKIEVNVMPGKRPNPGDRISGRCNEGIFSGGHQLYPQPEQKI